MNYSVNEFFLHLSLALSIMILFTFMFLFFYFFITKKRKPKKNFKTFSIEVDYSQSIEEMLKSLADDVDIDERINGQNFPINFKGVKKIKVRIFNYKKDISSLSVLNKIKNENFELGNIFELSNLISKYPKSFENCTLVSLGSYWIDEKNQLLKPYFYSGKDGQKKFGLTEDDGDWPKYCSFIGVI